MEILHKSRKEICALENIQSRDDWEGGNVSFRIAPNCSKTASVYWRQMFSILPASNPNCPLQHHLLLKPTLADVKQQVLVRRIHSGNATLLTHTLLGSLVFLVIKEDWNFLKRKQNWESCWGFLLVFYSKVWFVNCYFSVQKSSRYC